MYDDRKAFPTGVNQFVRGMQYASALTHGQPTEFTLGTPAAGTATAVATAVAANSAANTIVALSYTADTPYGRNLVLAVSGVPGTNNVQDVYGYDYLGQPMIERFTGASAASAILYGKKLFYRVTQIKNITAASNAVTTNIGVGNRLGLPYKCDLAYAKENGLQIPIYKRDVQYSISRPAALAVAGGSVFVQAPFPGFVKNVFGYSYGAGSTNDPAITVKLATVAITGLTVTIDQNVSTSAAVVTGVPTTAGYNANNRFVANDVIEIVGTAAASAAGDTVGVTLTPTHFALPDTTDPATNVTLDPRGCYEPILTMDGTKEIRIALLGDNQVNASGNGGLHGIKHFFA